MKVPVISLLIFGSSIFTVHAQRMAAVADSIRKAYQIPEMAYAVMKPDSIVDLAVTGFHRSDLQDASTKANLKDYFHLGSNTKAITGFIAAYLVENKKIKWKTKLFDIYPQWKKAANPAYQAVTLEDLLSHRAGIPPYMSGKDYENLPVFTGSVAQKRLQFAQHLLTEAPVKAEGEKYNYSNAGYSLATAMLEKVSGKTWEQLVEEVLSVKLKLHYKLGWPNKNDVNQPWGHWLEKGKLTPLSPGNKYNLNLTEPAGDISMPLHDYAKFILLNLKGLMGEDNFLTADTYDYLHFGMKEYSIGWLGSFELDSQYSEHSGSAGTFFCYAVVDKHNKRAYVVLINSGTEEAQKGLFELFGKLVETYRN